MTDANSLGRQAIEQGYAAAEHGYEALRTCAGKSVNALDDVSADLDQFVRREPWIGLLAAFAVGYLAAQLVRRLSA